MVWFPTNVQKIILSSLMEKLLVFIYSKLWNKATLKYLVASRVFVVNQTSDVCCQGAGDPNPQWGAEVCSRLHDQERGGLRRHQRLLPSQSATEGLQHPGRDSWQVLIMIYSAHWYDKCCSKVIHDQSNSWIVNFDWFLPAWIILLLKRKFL